MAKSVTLQRKVTIYPDPKYHRLLLASSKADDISISAIVGKALKAYYDSLSAREIEDIISRSKIV